MTAAFLAALFDAWDRAGIRHAALRNYASWPHELGKDVDLLVHADDLERAGAEIRRLARRDGLLCVSRPKRNAHVLYDVVGTDGDGEHLLIDLVTDCAQRGLVYLPGAVILASRRRHPHGGFHVAAPGVERLALLFHCILDCRAIRASYAERLAALPVDDDFRRAATAAVGARLAARLAATPPAEALALRGAVLRAVVRRQPASAARWLRGRVAAVRDRVRAWVRPPGALVVVVGPDGAGKSTLSELLCDRLTRAGLRASAVYLGAQKPLLPTRRLSQQLRRRARDARPIHEGRQRRFRGFVHILADKWLRYLVHVRPRLVRGETVVVDRYFYDLRTFPNPLVHRPWIEAFVTRLVPQPTVAFSLYGAPDVIAARKRELTVGETARQLACFREVGRWVEHFHELPADGDVATLVRAMRTAVVRQWAGAPDDDVERACATELESRAFS